jgi:FkbM family methyltransferase
MRVVLAGLLGPGSRCVDGGANRGRITQWLVDFAPRGDHIAVEPIPDLAHELARRFPSVEVHCAALGEHAARADFTYFPSAPELSGFGSRECSLPGEVISVEVVALDDVVGDRTIDFVKLDLEGSELPALRGATRTLRACMPVVVFEHCRVAFGADMMPFLGTADYETTAEIHTLLVGELGYRIYDLDGDGPIGAEQFRRLYETAERRNFLARP